MGSTAAAAEKTEEELRREIDELLRQQRQVPKTFALPVSRKLYVFLSLSLSLSLSSHSVIVFPLTNFRLRSGLEILGDFAGEAFPVLDLATSPPTELVSEVSFDPYVLLLHSISSLSATSWFSSFWILGSYLAFYFIFSIVLSDFRQIGLTRKINLKPNADYRLRLSRY